MGIISSAFGSEIRRCAQGALVFAVVGMFTACAHTPQLGSSSDTLAPEEHLRLGASYEAQGMLSEAVGQYEAAVRLAPSCAECWLALGNTAFTEGRLNDAEISFRKALEAAPHNPGASNNLAMVVLARNGSLPEAEALAQDALRNSGPLRPYVLDTLANIYLRQERYAEAFTAINQAEEATPVDNLKVREQLQKTRKSIGDAAQTDSGKNSATTNIK